MLRDIIIQVVSSKNETQIRHFLLLQQINAKREINVNFLARIFWRCVDIKIQSYRFWLSALCLILSFSWQKQDVIGALSLCSIISFL